MTKLLWTLQAGVCLAAGAWIVLAADEKIDSKNLISGPAAFVDSRSLKPGDFRRITSSDLPKPYDTKSTANFPRLVPRPADIFPKAPAGFKVELYANQDLAQPREIRTAPNGDFFVADSSRGQIKIFRGRTADGKPQEISIYAVGLKQPFGIAFYPPGPNPQWVYVGNTGSVVRFPYKNGDLRASGAVETLATDIPSAGFHWTRALAFSRDGKRLFVSVGSGSNVDDPDTHPAENHRADILEYTPDGKFVKVYAAGIRNPVGLGVNPQTGEVWCSTNERDELGDNLVPDYITHVEEGGFYGWPWFYIGAHQDPRHEGKHPEMKDKVLVPDILLQPHSASLQLTFYDGAQFPAEYRGDLFASEHGSWNRANLAGYEVVRVPLVNGHSSGVYQDFLTGFVGEDGKAWGRPVGIAVAKDGALMVTDDGSHSIWRVSYVGK